ncbi:MULTISPECIES: alpha/beta fold hydrolase [unclassified Crossiella]|uniref:alpha/beta fold hydrolase n=1 Tax=unclassified Crossiella TaxID=2620835 RepID=UPI001FFE31E8|nr:MULTISPECIES: alpha/beta hydrolase [unclassified Crossiella]MCK2238835.1 alpha/beta hydrolase [Crossiella sp. S99.2]MCK2251595.1 alpha/beta hydrolase [Crossiella sp. S99.1]
MTALTLPQIAHRHVEVDGLRIFYREAGPADAPTLLLLHGFPTSSHQFRRLFESLGTDYHLIAPDLPGFGHSDTPDPAEFAYTFDHLAEVITGFVDVLDLRSYALYVFDYGAPVGFRLAQARPDRVTGLIVQNGNAYQEGISELFQQLLDLRPDQPGAEEIIRRELTRAGLDFQYLTGVRNPELVDPDSSALDLRLLDLPLNQRVQVALTFDYHHNLTRYPDWQQWLRTHTPPTLITWGRHDPFFTEAGARAYLRDLPDAQFHLFETGHFALEEHLQEIATLIAEFLDKLAAG